MTRVRGHLVRTAVLLAAIAVVNFFLPRWLPGSPLRSGAGAESAVLPSGAMEELRRAYGLDRPLAVQFADYLAGLVRGDLGRSLATHRLVKEMIAERLPWTLFLVGTATMVSVLCGAGLGTAAVWRQRSAATHAVEGVVVAAGALPEFLVAMALILLLGTTWRVFPTGGATTPFLSAGPLQRVTDVLWHAVLPGSTLIVALLPAFFLLARNALSAVMGERYLLVARGKGLPERRVMWHAWRNALPAVLTLFGLRLAFAVTGAALVERLFAYPGMGLLLFEAVQRRDYPVMQGVFLVASAAVIGVTLAMDVLAGILDPRTAGESA